MRRLGCVIAAVFVFGCGGPEFSDTAYELFQSIDASVGERGDDSSTESDAAVYDAPVSTDARASVDAAPPADAGDSGDPVDASPVCDASYASHPPIACQQTTISAPTEYGLDAREDAGGDVCEPHPMPDECQCAGTYTCDCLLASTSAPECPSGESRSCVLSYPELGGIVVVVCR